MEQQNINCQKNRTKQAKLNTNPKFGKDYEISQNLQSYLNAIEDKHLLRYGISRFKSEFIFGQSSKQILNKLHMISFKKIGQSPNTMHKYGSGDVIPNQDFNQLKQSLLPYLHEIFNIDKEKQCYLFTDFSVHYGKGYDNKLDEHVDDSDVTINICLKNQNDLTGLKFNQIPDTLFSVKNTRVKPLCVQMNQGDILIHSGKQRHQVVRPQQISHFLKQQSDKIEYSRVNLILWVKFRKITVK